MPDVGALAGHVGAGDDEHAGRVTHRRVIGDEIVTESVIEDRMSPVVNLEPPVFGEFRSCAAALDRVLTQPGHAVESADRVGDAQ